jgi:hypothetical protein
MKIKLLRKIAAAIEENPGGLNMSILHSNRAGYYVEVDCATAHCICGWGAVITGKSIDAGRSSEPVFGINSVQRSKLFWTIGWPAQFSAPYRRATSAESKAAIAIARIEHFVKTKGAE